MFATLILFSFPSRKVLPLLDISQIRIGDFPEATRFPDRTRVFSISVYSCISISTCRGNRRCKVLTHVFGDAMFPISLRSDFSLGFSPSSRHKSLRIAFINYKTRRENYFTPQDGSGSMKPTYSDN